MTEKRLAEMTEYPKIFGKAYWGRNLVTDGIEDRMGRHVIEKRNEFAREFHLRRSVSVPTLMSLCGIDSRMDHLEIYEGVDGYVLVVSNYNDDDIPDVAKMLGFKKYKDLYGFGATSYVAFIPRVTVLNKDRTLSCIADTYCLLKHLGHGTEANKLPEG